MLEDRLLIWKLKNGHEQGLVRAYGKYKNYLLKIAHALLSDPGQVEDVVQDVFVSLAESAHRLKVDGHLKGYLVRCLINRVHNLKKSKRATVTLCKLSEPCSGSGGPDHWVILNDEQTRANAALNELPYEQREVIALHLRGGLKFRQIAELQGLSINTVQSRYRYGLDTLRSILNGEAGT
ncbi:MAG: sigma-70 family RNA polymerase sigma factor [Planctomycetes bacterium]|nr:sigma-70 family RNA polymerase sigma factor [Planctomycetota bacterium]